MRSKTPGVKVFRVTHPHCTFSAMVEYSTTPENGEPTKPIKVSIDRTRTARIARGRPAKHAHRRAHRQNALLAPEPMLSARRS
jgi:hypothetical protein